MQHRLIAAIAFVASLASSASQAQMSLIPGTYRGTFLTNSVLQVEATDAVSTMNWRFQVTEPRCTGHWDVHQTYHIPRSYVSGPVDPVGGGSCSGYLLCNGIIWECGGMTVQIGDVAQPSRTRIELTTAARRLSFEQDPSKIATHKAIAAKFRLASRKGEDGKRRRVATVQQIRFVPLQAGGGKKGDKRR